MKTILLSTFIFTLTCAFSISIPKKVMGQYQAQVPDFEFEDNGHTVQASGYTLSLILREDYMWYKTEMLEFYGEYKDLKDDDNFIDVSVEVSNDLSIDFDFDISYNKRTGALAVKGLRGIPDLEMAKSEIKVVKKH